MCRIEKVIIIISLIAGNSLISQAGTFNNEPAYLNHSGESRDSSFSSSDYDYMYGQRFEKEMERNIRTGRDVNYCYVPRRPGTSNCSRYDRNYVYCD